MARNPPETVTEAAALRRSLSHFPTGVAVVTTCDDAGAPVGLTVSSFNSVSLSPPLILWSLSLTARSLADFRRHGAFAVNVLASDQGALCRRFAADISDRFAGIGWQPGHAGVPVLDGVAAVFECRLWARYPGGDHEIFLGEVIRHAHRDTPPLVYGRGQLAAFPEAGI